MSTSKNPPPPPTPTKRAQPIMPFQQAQSCLALRPTVWFKPTAELLNPLSAVSCGVPTCSAVSPAPPAPPARVVPAELEAAAESALASALAGGSWPTAAIPVENPYCSCRLTGSDAAAEISAVDSLVRRMQLHSIISCSFRSTAAAETLTVPLPLRTGPGQPGVDHGAARPVGALGSAALRGRGAVAAGAARG